MKQLEKLFSAYHKNLKIDCNVFFGEDSFVFGKTLSEENNTAFTFLYKGKTCKAILEGKGDKIVALIEVLKATFNYSDSQTIKDKSDYVLKCLMGIAGSRELNKKYSIDYSSCLVMAIKCDKSSNEIASFLQLYTPCLTAIISEDLCAIIKPSNSDKEDYLSVTRFAKILKMAITEELGISVKIGIGNPVEDFLDVSISYKQAYESLNSGAENDRGVFSYLEILPKKMLDNLTIKDRNYFLKPFTLLLDNKELLSSAKEFLNSDLNINKASEKLFIHRNTLIYRLNKIERLVGLDLRNFNDAVTFRFICLIDEIKGESYE